MKIIAIIPARAGSKRLPGKNTKVLAGKPLINWTIDAALESKCCESIIVSTDDEGIADIAKKAGASVPFLRPANLASDTATSVDVVLHAVKYYESINGTVDGVMLLQPTSPFRTPHSICAAVNLFAKHKGKKSVISVSKAASNPSWCFYCEEDTMVPLMGWEHINKRSQDYNQAWELNGSIYILAPESLKRDRAFVTESSIPFFQLRSSEAIDIDTAEDWALAEYFISG
ncbi:MULTISPECIES: cytidylyltransferase domain-containing protein [Gammaproteobacteria]|uniref:acylneuraminate cytidylyltransferase family protein n=1 Tax=Gammaproteobacteria TaxID=1236 RepID=UPI000DD0380E|nr:MULTISPECIES: acylneuraminate cytidylyltransferase family protein [Gammaproteobacteria]RTE86064.1 acylneuraminate cytidylyltransferase family protein [Aliidiomarina sp. B3213]TCZ91418.1 acylneuraminate cytidylyltransferase family protein [Lysobacter sp. N42]